ncbi:MAG TPA: hypothetical protein VFQ53_27480 [Kofleriaceae bacterium]|nr:hypothetical protein [Kofleriaceae bacterium]
MTESMTTQKLVAHDSIAVIAAGGITALGARTAEDQRTSPVTARAYTHPAMEPGKVVIRLEPEAVAAGVDAEMAAFGFSEPRVGRPIGQVRSRTLGFPGWALVHEPKKAKAALEVTEDMRKAKRLVASKPGHAKDAFEKIAKQLQRSAPQFLPSFWEEVGRVVADQASSSMAAQCFERARQAERAFKLKIDPDDSDAVMVEFALLGALSAKTLSQYAKDLTKSAGGAEAYRRFRAIVVKRALGGMPPYSGMGKDLRALAKAANLDTTTEDKKLLAELIEAPGVGKAPIEFWTTYRESLIELAKQDAVVKQRLRALWPEPRGGTDETREAFTTTWVELLDEIGALDDVPEEGLGAWISRMFKFAGKTERTEAVLRANAERLVQTNQKISVLTKTRWSHDLNLDLAELALELGIGLNDPDDYEDFFAEAMTVDPVRVAEHPIYSKKLVEAVSSMIGNAEHEHRMRGKAGFASARRRWLEEQLEGLQGKSFSSVRESLETLDSKTTAEFFLAFPELHERLAKTDLSATLAAHLRAGIADEFGWPAYEEAAAKLGTPMKLGGAFPVMTAWNTTKALALGPTGVIAEHDFVYKPKEHEVEHVWYLDGQFLVDLDVKGEYETVQYWSSKPKDKFPQKVSYHQWSGLPNQWQHPDGGVTLGGKLFRAGDTELSEATDFLCDGRQMWVEHNDKYYAFDPVTGKRGEPSEPAFVSEFRREGWNVSAILLPAPVGLAGSPLGMRDGLLGLRTRSTKDYDDDRPNELERIDGVPWKASRRVLGLVSFPGTDKPRPIDSDNVNNPRFLGGDGEGIEVLSDDNDIMFEVNQEDWAARGWGDLLVPPAAFWDYLTPRDPEGSAALRGISDDAAREILEAAKRDVASGGDKSGRPMPQAEAAIRRLLAIGNDRIVRGVAGFAEHAAELARQVDELAASRSKENADPGGTGLLGEAAQLRKLATALAAGRPTKIKDFELDPRQWLRNARARAALSLSPIADADDRRKARDLVQALSGTIFADDMSRMRVFDIEEPDDYDDPNEWDTLVIERIENSVFAIHASSNWAIEVSSDGVWRTPAPWKIGDDEVKLGKGIGTAWADRFLELPDAPIAWDPEIAVKLAARAELSVQEATLLWINSAGMSTWNRDWLGKKNRELLGLKLGEADAAQTTFKELDGDKILELFENAMPDDPLLLATPLAPGGLVERLGDAWKAKFGKRAKIPQDLIAAAKKDLDLSDELGWLLPAFAGGLDDATWLRPDLRPLHQLGGWSKEKKLDNEVLIQAATMIAWLFVARPVGCPIRAGIPGVVEKLREALGHPDLVWPLEDMWVDDDDKKEVARQQGIVLAVGGKPVEMPKDGDEECIAARDDGTCVVAAYKSQTYVGFRPAKLDAKSRKRVEQLAKLVFDEDIGGDPLAKLKGLELVRSDAFGAFADRVRETPVMDGSYEANPLVSAPKLVAKVAKNHGLSDDAAALYLQTLALAEPTQARVQLWNGWKPKQYAVAAAELAKKKLVVEGKRERAGRSIFVKGGYSKGEGKNLPMEEWKQPFYDVLPRHLPAEPCHLLFARAYKRVEDGDKP